MQKDFIPKPAVRKKLIVAALRERGTLKCTQLEEICGGCSPKSIRRSIGELRNDRWPIEGGDSGYSLREPSIAEKGVTVDEHFGVLMIAGCSIDKHIGRLFPNVGEHLKRELFGLDDIEETEDALTLDRSISVPQSIYSKKQIGMFGKVARNIVDELAISFEYNNVWQSKDETRSVYPVQLKLKDGVWYLLSWDLDKDDIRMFKLSKIKNVRVCEKRWKRPQVSCVQSVLKSAHFSIWDRGEEPLKIGIQVEGHAKEHVEHYELTSNQEIIQQGGNTIVVLQTSDVIGVLSWCRHYIHNIQILYPESVKKRFLGELQAGFEKHKI